MESMEELQRQIATLKLSLEEKEKELAKLLNQQTDKTCSSDRNGEYHKLPKWAIERYSRQILLSDIGVKGQLAVCRSKVLIVGAGGLGCPAASYLAGAGVGEIGIVDYDTVDVTNVHRQLLHSEESHLKSKVESAMCALKRINSHVNIVPYSTQLNSGNAIEIISKYDVVLDCSDNVPTRYLLNDACVLTKKTLISGSALKMEGQLTIYNYTPLGNTSDLVSTSPCYRCIFPVAPPPEVVGSCSAQGVCGPIPGVIGSLQALEAIKYIVGTTTDKLLVGRLLLFDGADMTFRVVKLRPKNPSCDVCSAKPKITKLIDYELFCKSKAVEKDLEYEILSDNQRISAKELSSILKEEQRPLLIDVRTEPEFQMCHIDGAVNYSIEKLDRENEFAEILNKVESHRNNAIFICRRGNDSQVVAQKVIDRLSKGDRDRIKDVVGGLHSWSKYVDNEFPIY